MSHVTLKESDNADQQITDIAAIKAACQHCGLEFREGQKTFHTWATDHNGRLVGDWPVPEGYDASEIASGKCEHAIGLPGQRGKSGTQAYEIGLVKSKKHPGTYSTMYDFWGGALENQAGKGLSKLRKRYMAEAVKNKCEAEGDTVTVEEMPNGDIIVEQDPTVRLAAQGLI